MVRYRRLDKHGYFDDIKRWTLTDDKYSYLILKRFNN